MTRSDGKTPGEKEDEAVVAALRRVGLDVQSVYDLVNMKTPDPAAVPVLIEVPEARPVAAPPLLREFLSLPSNTRSQPHTKYAA